MVVSDIGDSIFITLTFNYVNSQPSIYGLSGIGNTDTTTAAFTVKGETSVRFDVPQLKNVYLILIEPVLNDGTTLPVQIICDPVNGADCW